MKNGSVIGLAGILIVFAGPSILALGGWFEARGTTSGNGRIGAWDWKWTITSALLYVLAFNLTFFIQEFFLVLPKAFTPGLRPTLFHNNHSWDGTNRLANLFQGTGALATLLAGGACALWLRRGVSRSGTLRLFLFWMAYSGVFMALPQVVIGALSGQSDIGMAMEYLGLGTTSKTLAALIALALIPLLALCLGRLLLDRLSGLAPFVDARVRRHFLFTTTTLPALLALPVIALFRIPREWIEVLLVPSVVSMIGLVWIQAGAWRFHTSGDGSVVATGSIGTPLVAVLSLLLVFQVLLRPGIPFY